MCARCWRLTPAQHSNLTSPHAAARIVMFSSFSVFRKQSRHALYGKRAAIARRAQIHLLITSCTDSRTSPKGVLPLSSGKIGGNCPTIFRKVFPVSNFVEIGKAVAPPWRLNQARLFANKILRPNGGWARNLFVGGSFGCRQRWLWSNSTEPEGRGPGPHALPHDNCPLQVRAERVRHPHLLRSPTIRFEYLRGTNEDAHASCPRGGSWDGLAASACSCLTRPTIRKVKTAWQRSADPKAPGIIKFFQGE
jgi:hypothetical protein